MSAGLCAKHGHMYARGCAHCESDLDRICDDQCLIRAALEGLVGEHDLSGELDSPWMTAARAALANGESNEK